MFVLFWTEYWFARCREAFRIGGALSKIAVYSPFRLKPFWLVELVYGRETIL